MALISLQRSRGPSPDGGMGEESLGGPRYIPPATNVVNGAFNLEGITLAGAVTGATSGEEDGGDADVRRGQEEGGLDDASVGELDFDDDSVGAGPEVSVRRGKTGGTVRVRLWELASEARPLCYPALF